MIQKLEKISHYKTVNQGILYKRSFYNWFETLAHLQISDTANLEYIIIDLKSIGKQQICSLPRKCLNDYMCV